MWTGNLKHHHGQPTAAGRGATGKEGEKTSNSKCQETPQKAEKFANMSWQVVPIITLHIIKSFKK